MNEIKVNVSDATMEIIRKAAEASGIPVPNMVKIIISEWAIRNEVVFNAKSR